MTLLGEFAAQWTRVPTVAASPALAQRAYSHALAQLLTFGRHTLTGVLCTAGCQFRDWTAAYRLYRPERLNTPALFAHLRQQVCAAVPPGQPLVVAMDDSLLRRSGPHVPGATWQRDPLSPPFQTNLVRGQRVLQLAAIWPGAGQGDRAIPIQFTQVPTPPKPARHAPAAAWAAYEQQRRAAAMSRHGAAAVQTLRQQLDAEGAATRPLTLVVDGRFTVRTLYQALPAHTHLLGRCRKDAKLYLPPSPPTGGRGRPRRYGAPAPTPWALEHDPSYPEEAVNVTHLGQTLGFRVKTRAPVYWAPAGTRPLRLLVIRPPAHLQRAGQHWHLHTVYLLSTDLDTPLATQLLTFLQRWDIEVNFRDEKTLLGVGQAQVTTPHANQQVPALAVAAYSLLLLASATVHGQHGQPLQLPRPKWQRRPPVRPTTPALINELRHEILQQTLSGAIIPHFTAPPPAAQSAEKIPAPPPLGLTYAIA